MIKLILEMAKSLRNRGITVVYVVLESDKNL